MVTRGSIKQLVAGGAAVEEQDDISLLMAISQHRDSEAFTQLCERHRGRAFNAAFRILRDQALAEDAVQDAMLSIWRLSKPSHLKDAGGSFIVFPLPRDKDSPIIPVAPLRRQIECEVPHA